MELPAWPVAQTKLSSWKAVCCGQFDLRLTLESLQRASKVKLRLRAAYIGWSSLYNSSNKHSYKVVKLKRLKLRIVVHLFSSSFFSSQPSAWAQDVLHLKLPPVSRKFSGMIIFSFFLSVTSTYLMCFFAGKEGAEYTSPFVGACARVMHQLEVHGWHHITIFIENRAQASIYFLKILAEIKKM